MVPLFSCKKERLQIYATLAAAQTCDSSKIRMLVDTKGVIWSMLKYLKKATEDPDYVYEGAGLLELLDGIDKLACADPNKKKVSFILHERINDTYMLTGLGHRE